MIRNWGYNEISEKYHDWLPILKIVPVQTGALIIQCRVLKYHDFFNPPISYDLEISPFFCADLLTKDYSYDHKFSLAIPSSTGMVWSDSVAQYIFLHAFVQFAIQHQQCCFTCVPEKKNTFFVLPKCWI